MDVGAPRSRPLKPRAAGAFEGAIGSFRLNLAAEGKSPKTVRMYTEAVQWFAAAHLLREACRADWDEVDGQDIRRWIAWLLSRYSDSYASNQYRALQQFFRWWAGEEELPDPMAKLHPPKVTEKLVPFSPAKNYQNWSGPARAGRSLSAGTTRSSRCSGRPASGCRSWPGSGMTRMTLDGATLTCGSGRSGSAARAARRGSSGLGTKPLAGSTGTSGSGPGTARRTGRSCG